MEGYIWKKGRSVPVMKRRFAVQKGTMLVLYTSEEESKRLGAVPRKVLEVVAVRDWMDPFTSASASPPASPTSRVRMDRDPRAFEVHYLCGSKGGTTASHPGVYKCRADSKEARQLWVDAIRHALQEPDRIARDEIEEAQRDLGAEGELHQQAIKAAADAVQEAKALTLKQAECDLRIQQSNTELAALQSRLDHAQLLLDETIKRHRTTRDALELARDHAHSAEIEEQAQRESLYSAVEDKDHSEQIARLAAQVEVDAAAEDTQRSQVTGLQTAVADVLQLRRELTTQFQSYAEQGQRLRDTAGQRIEEAHGASRRRKLRITSWSAGDTARESAGDSDWTPPTSQLDPLVEGYLQCKHPTRNTLHRRYYVLVGNTLCWYTDVDAYVTKMDCPSGVLHVASVSDWDGHLAPSNSGFSMGLGGVLSPRRRNDSGGAKKKATHTFAVNTVEGTTLLCSAPTRDSAANWTAALHISLTMPPLSPHRAVAAKARRDSFDLLASMGASSGTTSLPAPGTIQRRHSSFHGEATSGSDVTSNVTATMDADPSHTVPEEEARPADSYNVEPLSAQKTNLSTVYVEGYLVQRNSATTSVMMKKKYCVLSGLEFGVFDSLEAYRSAIKGDGEDDVAFIQRWTACKDLLHVCGVREWDGHARLLQYHHAFQIQTISVGDHQRQQQQAVTYCSAATATEKTKWLHGIREALLKYRDTVLSPTRRQDSIVKKASRDVLRITTDMASSNATLPVGESGDSDRDDASNSECIDDIDEYAAAAGDFRDVMEQYYAEHHPSKLHDVHMLVEKYRHRERALVEHLDRIHSTSLMNDPHMAALLQRLNQFPPSPPRHHQQQNQSKRGSTGVRSGLADFVSMTGHLSWWDNNEFASSYCVLSINKLVRYRSQSHHATEPHAPLMSYLISSVYEFPPPPSHRTFSPRSGGNNSASKHVFYLAAAVATSSSSSKAVASNVVDEAFGVGVTLVDLVLAASTSEDKLRWMAKIRSGLGFAHAHSDTGGISTTISTLTTSSEMTSDDQPAQEETTNRSKLRRKLLDYYLQQNPRRVGEVDSLLAYFAGRERQLLVSLDSTYGTTIRHDDAFISLLPHVSSAAQTGSKDAHLETVMSVKHPTLGADFQRCLCVLNGSSLTCYDADTQSTRTLALLSSTVTKLNTLSVKLSTMLVLSVETFEHGVVLLRADTQTTLEEWSRALRAAIEARQQKMALEEMNTLPEEEPLRQLFGALTAFYRSHNPDKVGEVGTLLRAFRGRELRLLEQIDGIYHSQLSQNPAIQALCTAITSSSNSSYTQHADGSDETVRMEGYLIKRGHMMPSMRKRYCVLVDNRISYFVTQNDSRDPKRSSKPQGTFLAASVSDWNGQTSARNYAHGIEIEAADARTFFCAAPTAEEKNQWIDSIQRGIVRASAAEDSGSSLPAISESDAKVKVDEEKEVQEQRVLLRERLVQFYRERNPKKIGDVELLLSYYAGRELALLEAIDETYDATLAGDDELLALIPPSAKQSEALLTLKYDGHLRQTVADRSRGSSEDVYVAVDGLRLAFFATREAFKSGMSPPPQAEATLLAVKSLDGPARFAVETTEHEWIYLEAVNGLDKRQWMLVLQAALDTVLARNILDEEQEAMRVDTDSGGSSDQSVDISTRGQLLVRMDLDSLEFHSHVVNAPTTMVGCYCLLQNTNELSIHVRDDGDRRWRFKVRATRAWHPSPTSSPVSNERPCRFPFQVMTDQQFVISCGAPSDIDRAKWIHQIRLGAEQATALEMLEDQLLEAKEELKTRPQLKARGRRASIVVPSSKLTDDESSANPSQSLNTLGEGGDEVTKGSLLLQLVSAAKAGATIPSQADAEHVFIAVTERGVLTVFENEATCTEGKASVYCGRIMDFARLEGLSHSPPSPQRHLLKLFNRESTPSSSQALSLVVQDAEQEATATRIAHFFPASEPERDVWLAVFTGCVGIRKGEALLADEKVILALEGRNDSHDSSESGEAKPSERKNESDYEAEEKRAIPGDFYPGAAIEGALIPWCASETPVLDSVQSIKSTQFKPRSQLYAVLIGCRLLGFTSRSEALGRSETAPPTDVPNLLIDVEIAQVADWEPPEQIAHAPIAEKELHLDSTGFKVDGKTARGTATFCFTAPSMTIKYDWIRVIRQEVGFSNAEQDLDSDAKVFARQVAEDLHPTATTESAVPERVEGYVRVRHHFLGAIWRERYMVLRNNRLVVYANARDAGVDTESKKSIETHEAVSVDKWQPLRSGGSRGSNRRCGFRVTNVDGGSLECTVVSEAEASRWITSIRRSVDEASQSKFSLLSGGSSSTRDAALPFISGAAMEGFLQLKDRVAQSKFPSLSSLGSRKWKTRYCVLMDTHLLLYETQAEAIASDSSIETANVKPPLAVYEVARVNAFDEASRSSVTDRESEIGTHSEAEMDPSTVRLTFIVSTGGEVQAKAQSPLECKRWLHAVEDVLAQAAACVDQIAQAAASNQEKAAAREQVKSRLLQMQSDAMRQSMLLRDALKFVVPDVDTSESDSDKYYESDDNENTAGESNALRHRPKSDYIDRSPESSPMRKKPMRGASSFVLDQRNGESAHVTKEKDTDGSSWSLPVFSSFMTCFSRCIPAAGISSSKSTSDSKRSIAPLGVPGFPSSAALSNPLYECDYYKDDSYDPNAIL